MMETVFTLLKEHFITVERQFSIPIFGLFLYLFYLAYFKAANFFYRLKLVLTPIACVGIIPGIFILPDTGGVIDFLVSVLQISTLFVVLCLLKNAFPKLHFLLIVPAVSLIVFSKYTSVLAIFAVSFISFRVVRFLVDCQGQKVGIERLLIGINYIFFVPTFFVGPITSYRSFEQDFKNPAEIGRLYPQLERLLIGIAKLLIFANVIREISTVSIMEGGFVYPWIEIPLTSVMTLAYLYLNFSGIADIAIVTSRLVGIRVDENFNRPYLATSVEDFWKRWHITLTSLIRSVLFQPVLMALTRRFRGRYFTPINCVTFLLTFVAIGLWHDLTFRFFLFGVANGIAMCLSIYVLRPLFKGTAQRNALYRKTISLLGWMSTMIFMGITISYAMMQPDIDLGSILSLLTEAH